MASKQSGKGSNAVRALSHSLWRVWRFSPLDDGPWLFSLLRYLRAPCPRPISSRSTRSVVSQLQENRRGAPLTSRNALGRLSPITLACCCETGVTPGIVPPSSSVRSRRCRLAQLLRIIPSTNFIPLESTRCRSTRHLRQPQPTRSFFVEDLQ